MAVITRRNSRVVECLVARHDHSMAISRPKSRVLSKALPTSLGREIGLITKLAPGQAGVPRAEAIIREMTWICPSQGSTALPQQ
jgi:hypothetical protein